MALFQGQPDLSPHARAMELQTNGYRCGSTRLWGDDRFAICGKYQGSWHRESLFIYVSRNFACLLTLQIILSFQVDALSNDPIVRCSCESSRMTVDSVSAMVVQKLSVRRQVTGISARLADQPAASRVKNGYLEFNRRFGSSPMHCWQPQLATRAGSEI